MRWDKGLEYTYAFSKILNSMKRNRRKTACYDAVLLTQLRNGSRISEAVRAFKEFIKSGKVEIEVILSKKKKAEVRLMIIPNELLNLNIRDRCVWIEDIDDDVLVKRIKVYCISKYKFNTHSLRYAFITYLLKNGVNPSIIAKITKHSKLDFILTYTQEKAAAEILKSID